MDRLAEPSEDRADPRNVEPERADELSARRVSRIDEVIVVTLEEVVPVLNHVDPMEDGLMEKLIVVQHDFPHLVARFGADNRKVVLHEQRPHADAVSYRVGDGTAELDRSKDRPELNHGREADNCDGDGRSTRFHRVRRGRRLEVQEDGRSLPIGPRRP